MLTHFVRSEPLKWNSGTLLELEDIKGGGSSKLDGCRPLAFIVFFPRNFFFNDDTSGQITFLSQRTNIETREFVQILLNTKICCTTFQESKNLKVRT